MIIGISGKAGCGKSALARILVKALGPEWQCMSLGDEVKKEAAELYGFPLALAYDPVGKNFMVKVDWIGRPAGPEDFDMLWPVRKILQYWGTDVRRAEDPAYWVDKLAANMPVGKNIIIDDVRFVSEVEFIKANGGKVFRIHEYPGYRPPEIGGDHISETELDDYLRFYRDFYPRFGELQSVADTIAQRLLEDVTP